MRFSRDRRGQSVVVGTVILFGFLILALSLYQVQVVPQQNGQVEFQHFEEVENDLVDLRAGILQAASTDQPQYRTIQLGTSYSTRLFGINPPQPGGTIRTSEPYNITITPESGDPINVSTRFVEYRPGYNELDRLPTWYDASVLYLDGRDQGDGLAVIEDQALVEDGEVRIVAVQNEFRRSGTGKVTMALLPSDNVTKNIPAGNLTVSVPTRLNESEWETQTDLPTTSDVYGGVSADPNEEGVYRLTLDTTAENLTVDSVGLGAGPEDAAQNANAAGDAPVQQSTVIRVNDDARLIGTGDKENAGVEFSISNARGQTVELQSVVIESTTSRDAEELRNSTGTGQTVISVSSATTETYEVGNDGYTLQELAVLSSPLSIVPGNDAVVRVTYFTDGTRQGNNVGNYVDMTGTSITIRFNFSDGTQRTVVVSPQ